MAATVVIVGLLVGRADRALALHARAGSRARSPSRRAFADPASVFAAGELARQEAAARGVVGAIAAPLFQIYLVPFEITSILLLAAIVGAVVLAKRKVVMLLGPPLGLSAILFSLGVAGVLLRRNAIVLFMCIELMLNAVNLTFVALAQLLRGQRLHHGLLRHDGGGRGGGGGPGDHPRDLPPQAVGGSPEHQPAAGLMTLTHVVWLDRRACRSPGSWSNGALALWRPAGQGRWSPWSGPGVLLAAFAVSLGVFLELWRAAARTRRSSSRSGPGCRWAGCRSIWRSRWTSSRRSCC